VTRSTEASDRTILAIDNVPLELPLAGVGSRVLAVLLDYCLISILQLTWVIAVGFGVGMLGSDLGFGWLLALYALGLFALQWGYFAAFEMLTTGQTPGKRAVSLRVVSRHGGRASNAAILVRNLIRTIDLVTGVPLLLIDRGSRRLGDIVAGTIVVHVRTDEHDELALGNVPPGWGAREVAVAESFFRRAELMEQGRARRLAELLLSHLERRDPDWAGARSSADPIAALRDLLGVQGAG